ncbi:MAG TPA: cysteine desulfurase CsdA [Saprospirales bacterium]|nr:cysteine desulfurase CsdA [Saprospirales bacterium]HAY71336.1 cysteine desulfurase CsdA [Saprospirales bacterium]HRQ29837.1 SufS family cysteine desulfurase [Saprospiraceae bacterium]
MNELEIADIRSGFPALQMKVYGKPVVYFDSAATSLKPARVINAISDYYSTINSNVHRGSYRFSQLSSDAFDQVRQQVKSFINARSSDEIVFTGGTTESINIVANGLGGFLKPGDDILISEMEHHSNMVPWQFIAKRTGAKLKFIPVDQNGNLDWEAFISLINFNTKILAITQTSNVLGTINPVKNLTSKAHEFGTLVLVDGAQGIVHGNVDVQDLDCDFYCFSAHKMYGPMGVGILFGKKNKLDLLEPLNYGGGMIDQVTLNHTSLKSIPQRLEAGTPNVSGVVGLGAAIDFLNDLGWDQIKSLEQNLSEYMLQKLKSLGFVKAFGDPSEKAPIYSIYIDGVHSYDLGTLLDKFGIACRTGYHCTQVLHEKAGLNGTLRASLAFYNTKDEIDLFANALVKTREMLT